MLRTEEEREENRESRSEAASERSSIVKHRPLEITTQSVDGAGSNELCGVFSTLSVVVMKPPSVALAPVIPSSNSAPILTARASNIIIMFIMFIAIVRIDFRAHPPAATTPSSAAAGLAVAWVRAPATASPPPVLFFLRPVSPALSRARRSADIPAARRVTEIAQPATWPDAAALRGLQKKNINTCPPLA